MSSLPRDPDCVNLMVRSLVSRNLTSFELKTLYELDVEAALSTSVTGVIFSLITPQADVVLLDFGELLA